MGDSGRGGGVELHQAIRDLGELDIDAELGRGALTTVSRARRGDQRYALKQARGGADADQALAAFRREGALLACLDHPGVVRAHAVGLHGGRPALVTELVGGTSLAERLLLGPLPQERVVELGIELADALAAAHRIGLVHRDLKPQNVMLPTAGTAKLIDFGLATLVGDAVEDAAVGTFIYTAPEQTGMLKRPVDNRSDLYSLGAVLFECLTGRPPFLTSDVGELLRLHAAAAPPDVRELCPDADPMLARVLSRLLAKDPDDRYHGALDLLDDLRRVRGGDDRSVPVRAPDGPLCGRGDELEVLTRWWRQARAGSGGVAFLRGPTGSGRTRLAGALEAVAAADGALVLSGRCLPDDGTPLSALRAALEGGFEQTLRLSTARWETVRSRVHEAAHRAGPGLLKPLFPALGVALDDVPDSTVDGRDDQLVAAIAVFLAELARQWGGAVLHLDDAQWLDASTRRLLARLAVELPAAPLRVLLSVADDVDGEAVTALRGECAGAVDTEVRLGPLDDDATACLAASRLPGAEVTAELTAHVAARTGGFPLAVVEYLRLLVDTGTLIPFWGTWQLDLSGLDALPATGNGLPLVLSRLEGLSAPDRCALTVAAVVGNRFRLDLLSAAAGMSGQAVSDAIGAALTRRLVEQGQDGRYGFVHPGVPVALREGLPDGERRRLHRQVADALERLGPSHPGDSDHVYQLARHHARAGTADDPAALYRASSAAGTQALRDLAPDQAVEYLEQAVRAAQDGGLRLAGDVHQALATAYLRVGRIADATQRLDLALATEQDPQRRAALWGTYAELHSVSFNDVQAVSDVVQGLRDCGRPLPEGWRAVIASLGSAVAAGLIRRTRIGFGTARGKRRDSLRAEVALLNSGAFAAAVGGRIAPAAVFTLRAVHRVNRLGPGPHYVRAYATLGSLFAVVRLRRRADRCFARAEKAAGALGDPALTALIDWLRAIGLLLGGLDSGEAWEEVMTRHARWLEPSQYVTSLGTQGLRLLLRGWPVPAQGCYERAMAHLPVGGRIDGTFLATLTVMVPAQRGRPAEATAALARLRASCADGSATLLQRGNVIVAGMMALIEQGEFGTPFEELIAEFESLGLGGTQLLPMHRWFYVYRAHGLLARCRLASDEDRPARLAAARRAVRDVRRHASTPLLRAAYGLLRATMLQQAGRPGAALRAVDRVERRYRALDAPMVALEAARIRARVLHQLGFTGEAEREAGCAHLIATRYELVSRARQLKIEFGLEDADSASGFAQRVGSRPSEAAHNRRLEAMQQVSMAAATVLDPQQLARVALTETLRILGAERAMLFLLDDEGQPRFSLGLDTDGHDLEAVTGYGSTLLHRVCETGEALVVTGTEEGAALGSRSVVVHGLRSIMIAPLQHKGRLMGVVYLDSRMARGVFTTDDVEVLTAVTSHVAVSLTTARAAQLELAVATARREQEVAEALRTSLAELSAILDPAVILDRLFTGVAGTLLATSGVLLHAAGDTLTVTSMTGSIDRSGFGCRFDLAAEAGLAELAAAAHPVTGPCGSAPEAVTGLLGTVPGWLAIPLRARDGLVGLILLGGEGFDDTRRDLGAALASQGMSAYDNAQLFSRVQELATTDDLTGIHNRRHFCSLAGALLGSAARGGRTLTAAMIDIDHFKRINDAHGHGVGDDVIREVAARLSGSIRDYDVLGRYGGEEFAVILPDVAADSRELAERFRRAVADTPIPTRDRPVSVTISIGLAVLAGQDSLDTLLARADHALYQAKQAGRNRVVEQGPARSG